MKRNSLLLVCIVMAVTCRAQIDWGQYSQTFTSNEDNGGPQLIAAIPKQNNAFWSLNPSSSLKNALQEDKDFTASRPSNFVAINTFDVQSAHFFVKDVSQNARYEYRVLKDGKQVVTGWSAVITPASHEVKIASTLQGLFYIGAFKADFGHYLVVDLRNKADNRIQSTAVVAWRPLRPTLFNIYKTNELNDFLQRLSHPDGYYMTDAERKKWRDQYGIDDLDAVTSLPKKMIVEAKDNSLIFVLKADIREKEQVEYELLKDNNVVRSWAPNDFDNNFIWLKEFAPGNYLLRIRYAAQPGNILEYAFEVKPPPGPSAAYLIGMSSLIAAFLALIAVIALYLKQKRRAKRESLFREKLELEMKGIKSQLNPHFIFNSLNSIQGLINTGKIKESNDYIVLFAKLMRNTLTLSDTTHVPLQQEIDYIDTYLKLEQLRFNFMYHIYVDPSLNTSEVNFPGLLLQPLVENAVKHGLDKAGSGKIEVLFMSKNAGLDITVKDNGKGFQTSANQKGYGLSLTRQRIKLLNAAAGEQQVTMNVMPGNEAGTEIQLTFKEWLK